MLGTVLVTLFFILFVYLSYFTSFIVYILFDPNILLR